jgi:simple sugar transport system substrate-binding protein
VLVAHFGPAPDFPFGNTMLKGMQDACTLINADCQWLGDWVKSWQGVPEYWEEALALRPDGIGTTITDPEVIRSYVQQASENGIPTVIFNVARGLDPDSSVIAPLYIGSDEYASGESNARRVFSEARTDRVTIRRGICANHFEEAPALAARCAGVQSVFDEEGVPLDTLSVPMYAADQSFVPQPAVAQIADYFASHPEANAIFMVGPQPVEVLKQYLQQAGVRPHQLYATTHDTSAEVFQMIQDGYLLQTIDQQPYMQGFQTIMSLYLYRQYGIRPSGFINTSSVVDQSNVENVTQLVEAGYR